MPNYVDLVYVYILFVCIMLFVFMLCLGLFTFSIFQV